MNETTQPAVAGPVEPTVRPWWPEYLMSTRHPETRPCTCSPDDNPPTPCARRYALTDCREADRVWTNEVLRLIQRHAPHIPMSEYGDDARATFIAFARAVAALGRA